MKYSIVYVTWISDNAFRTFCGVEDVGSCCNNVWKSIKLEWSWISSVVEDKAKPPSTSLIIAPIPPFKLDDVSSFDIVDMEQSKLVWTYKGALRFKLSVEELQSSLKYQKKYKKLQ